MSLRDWKLTFCIDEPEEEVNALVPARAVPPVPVVAPPAQAGVGQLGGVPNPAANIQAQIARLREQLLAVQRGRAGAAAPAGPAPPAAAEAAPRV